VALKTLVSIRT